MNRLKIKFYSDPGHGWGAVKRKLIEEMGLTNHISPYSYQKGHTVYLEEDRDLYVFMNALNSQRGQSVEFIHRHTDRRSPIRSYENYNVLISQ